MSESMTNNTCLSIWHGQIFQKYSLKQVFRSVLFVFMLFLYGFIIFSKKKKKKSGGITPHDILQPALKMPFH